MLWFRTPQKVYFKKGCLPVALDELKNYYNKTKAFIVTDGFLFSSGMTAPITDKLDKMGIQHTCFYEVAPDPTLRKKRSGTVESIWTRCDHRTWWWFSNGCSEDHVADVRTSGVQLRRPGYGLHGYP